MRCLHETFGTILFPRLLWDLTLSRVGDFELAVSLSHLCVLDSRKLRDVNVILGSVKKLAMSRRHDSK